MRIKINPNVIINEEAIINDIRKFTKTCAMTVVEEAQVQLEKFAFGEMAEYYTEYEPYIYIRTGQMGDLSYQTFMSNTGNMYEGGIIINSVFTEHERGVRRNGKEYTEEEIYEDVWVKGKHGGEMVGYGKNKHWRETLGVPNRINRLKEKAYSADFKNKLLAKGMAKAKSQSYSILKFS